MTSDRLRVGAAQFAGSTDLEHNLATCLSFIDQAAAASVDVVVLPEFANHLSVYSDAAHCRSVAVALDGEWLGAIADRARLHQIHVALTVTVPRDGDRVTVTSLLFGAEGQLLAQADKQTLMGNERAFLCGGTEGSAVASTRWGPVGVYACMDGVTFETPRTFAVRGARLLLNGLNSFALDEANLHIPVRAVENGVFVVAANKVGPLLPAAQVEAFSEALGIPASALDGAGESQVIAPDGTVLAQADRTSDALIWADIDLSVVTEADDRFGRRRPDIYGPLANPISQVPRELAEPAVAVACATNDAAATRAVRSGAALVVLAEGLALPPDVPDGVAVVTTTVTDGRRVSQLTIDGQVTHEQFQLHDSRGEPAVRGFGDGLDVVSTPFGDLALIVGDDHHYPEVARLAAIGGAHLVVVTWQPEHQWEADLALVERAAENRVCLVACAPASAPWGTVVLNPPRDSLWNPKRRAPFDGTINTPEITRLDDSASVLEATVHLDRARDREISRDTDLVAGRAWGASKVLVEH